MAQPSATITSLLNERIDAGDFPSAVYLVAEKGQILLQDALGLAVVEPEQIGARLDTIYDLASLTKVLVTGLLVGQMVEAGVLRRDVPAASYLRELDTDEKRSITVSDLLTHTSGLRNWLPMYLFADSPKQVGAVVAERPIEAAHASKVIYSDLNFFLLHSIIEEISRARLDSLAGERILRPLSLVDTAFRPDPAVKHRIAASEKGNVFERQTCIENGYLEPSDVEAATDFFRTGVIWGEAHDGNAYFMGGVAGHAGLFGTAEEVSKIAHQFLPTYTELLNPETCELYRSNFTPAMNEHRSLGFQLASTPGSTAGDRMSPESFGHTGFTGTSLWIDPVKERVFVLLTNRTHDHGLPFANINAVRRRFHDLAIGHLERN